ncbi:MAG: hypothetical protein HGGPFJEG_00798 [Ignavibacteria bacterium]|nr:hypothetical protein [Ignavibacteria bacterium]
MNDLTETNINSPTSDDKLLSLLCHLSSFLGGIILPIIIWATQKDKSKFVRFHSLQAIFFHISVAVIIIILVIVFLIIIFAGIGFSSIDKFNSQDNFPPFMIFIMIIFYGGIFVIVFTFFVYSVYLAVKAYKGELIRIPFIGNIIFEKVYR